MVKNIVILFFVLFCFLSTKAQSEKDEAKTFFLKVIQSYFESCDSTYSLFADSFRIVDLDTLVSKAIIKRESFCSKRKMWTNDIQSIEGYAKKYKIIVNLVNSLFTSKKLLDSLVKNEIISEPVRRTLFSSKSKYKQFSDSDYLVEGDLPIDSTQHELMGLFWFIIRKTPEGWKIYGTTK